MRMLALLALSLAASPLQAAPQGGAGCPPAEIELANPFAQGTWFSTSLALEGDVLVVGSFIAPSSSAAAVYERDLGGPGNWGQAASLFATGSTARLGFAASCDVSGDTVAVGSVSESHAYVFARDAGGAGNWGMVQKIASPIDQTTNFGGSIAVEGNTLVVGAAQALPFDYVAIYERSGGPWAPVAFFPAQQLTTAQAFGGTVALSGDILAVGDESDNELGNAAGAVTIYERSGGTWSFTARVLAPNGLSGQYFSRSVALDGDTLLVGADGYNGSRGTAWVFRRDPGGASWSPVAQLLPSIPGALARFGLAVSMSGEFAAVGAPTQVTGGCLNHGRVFLYARDVWTLDAWGEVAPLDRPSGGCGDNFGRTLSQDGRVLAVGSHNTGGSGRAYVYDEVTEGCTVAYCTAGTSAGGCRSAVVVSGTPSASAPSGFQVNADEVDGGGTGILFFGVSGPNAAPFDGGGILCALGPLQRTGSQNTGGSSGACDGALALDFNAWMSSKPVKAPPAGTTVYMQGWYQGPGGSSALSNAVQFTVQP